MGKQTLGDFCEQFGYSQNVTGLQKKKKKAYEKAPNQKQKIEEKFSKNMISLEKRRKNLKKELLYVKNVEK